ncbi:KamA family radical SAM protein [Thermodesulfobacteriota bacterium]
MLTILKNHTAPESWEQILSRSIIKSDDIPSLSDKDKRDIDTVVKKYPMLINPYYFSLLKGSGSPLYKQAVPHIREINDGKGYIDPLFEEALSPVPGLTHKYPDRVLFLVSSRCAMYCRFCNRKRKVGHDFMVSEDTIKEGLAYIKATKTIRDVLISGGDPLLLPDEKIRELLIKIRDIQHVEIIRIGTRVPCTLPQRITPNLVEILKKFHPVYINTHFNHPSEITSISAEACKILTNAGIPLGCQTVLLKDINDNVDIMMELMRRLLTIRVRPYYLFQADLAKGTSHFWTPLKKGLEIMEELQGFLSGIGVPRFMIDLPEGGGKIPVIPQYIKGIKGDKLVIKNYKGLEYYYPIN